MTDRTAAARVARDRARKQAAGMVRVTSWVPKTRSSELKDIASDMRRWPDIEIIRIPKKEPRD